MAKTITIGGFYSGRDARPQEARVGITISGTGMGESLTIDCKGYYRVSLPYRPIEKMALETRRQLRNTDGILEPTILLEGHDGLYWSRAQVWIRANSTFEMLSVEFEDLGQISVAYAPVEKMVRAERGSYA